MTVTGCPACGTPERYVTADGRTVELPPPYHTRWCKRIQRPVKPLWSIERDAAGVPLRMWWNG